MSENMNSHHIHDHTGMTSCNDGHCHIHPGVTSLPIMQGESHYHEIIGATTFQDEHYHNYRACTGPAINLIDGYHTHYASFETSYNDGHVHNITGFVIPVKY